MYCSNCGKEIPSGAAFCPNCGTKASSAPEPFNPTSTPTADSAGDAPAGPPDEPHPPKISPASTSPLEAVIGKNTAYYMAEFQKIEAGQKTRFNWAALFFGPYLCFYRRCPALFKRYFLLSYILLFATALIAAFGLALLNLTVLLACGVVILAAGILTLVNSIRLGRNFNREYYRHCQQQLALPELQRKNGVSIRNILLFILVLVLSYGLCSAFMMPSSAEGIREGYSERAAEVYAERAAAASSNDDFSIGSDSDISTHEPNSSAASPYFSNLPSGTYQVLIGRSRLISSIRIFETLSPYEEESPWYCDVISWGGGPDIADSYYGPATVTDDLQTIICGDYNFSIDQDGEPYFNAVLSEMSYGIIYYSADTSMEAGLNALIDMGNLAGNPLTQYAIDNYAESYGLDETLLLKTER